MPDFGHPAGLLVCSHRGPFTYAGTDAGIVARRGSGGLVTALSAVLRGSADVHWLACALSDVDRQVAKTGPAPGDGPAATLLDIPPRTHQEFYDDACVTGLGFVFHSLFDRAYTPVLDAGFGRAMAAYRIVNEAYAAEVARLAAGRAVLVEDYHLMFVADALRTESSAKGGPLAYFHHVPWCPPADFAVLPRSLRTEILGKLLAFDTLGFHCRRWADAFLACCDAFLPGAGCRDEAVEWRGRRVPIVVAPAQVDPREVQDAMAGPDARRWLARLRRVTGDRPVLARVDRVDLWKNVPRGFQAFEQLAGDNPTDMPVFLALLAKSRQHLPAYQRYLATCVREARRINRRLSPSGTGPIRLSVADRSDHARALAVLSMADAVLVNSTSDGLNLVAKESVLASEGRARLVLSENTGVYEEIGRWTHPVNPFDTNETATAIAGALRAGRAPARLLATVRENSPAGWVARRLRPVSG